MRCSLATDSAIQFGEFGLAPLLLVRGDLLEQTQRLLARGIEAVGISHGAQRQREHGVAEELFERRRIVRGADRDAAPRALDGVRDSPAWSRLRVSRYSARSSSSHVPACFQYFKPPSAAAIMPFVSARRGPLFTSSAAARLLPPIASARMAGESDGKSADASPQSLGIRRDRLPEVLATGEGRRCGRQHGHAIFQRQRYQARVVAAGVAQHRHAADDGIGSGGSVIERRDAAQRFQERDAAIPLSKMFAEHVRSQPRERRNLFRRFDDVEEAVSRSATSCGRSA